MRGGKMGEGSQKVQISSDKISKSWNGMYSMMIVVNNPVSHI